jgi:hypothetical protein
MASFLRNGMGVTAFEANGAVEPDRLSGIKIRTAAVLVEHCTYTTLPQVRRRGHARVGRRRAGPLLGLASAKARARPSRFSAPPCCRAAPRACQVARPLPLPPLDPLIQRTMKKGNGSVDDKPLVLAISTASDLKVGAHL